MKSLRHMALGECCEIIGGATPSTSVSQYWDGDILWATPKDLSNLEGHYISSTTRKLTQEGLESCAASILPRNSVLFSSRAPIGHVAINTEPMATNQGFKSFIPDSKLIDPKFLFHWLRANRGYMDSLGNGATFKEVSKAIVAKVNIPLPPLAEQRRIAAILDQADALLAKRRESLAQLETLKQSIFSDMFGDLFLNTNGYPISKLGDICDVRDGTHDSPKYFSKGYPLVTSKNLRDGKIDLTEVNLISEEDYIAINKRSKVDMGDILMPMIGTIGNPVLVEFSLEFAIKNMALIKFSNESPNRQFILSYLGSKSFDKFIEKKNKGGTQKFLALGEIRALSIPLPPKSLQEKFAELVLNLNKHRNILANALIESDILFQSLQYRAFKGVL